MDRKTTVPAIEICNDCDCELTNDCLRFDKSTLALYDFSEVKHYYNCFIKKETAIESRID